MSGKVFALILLSALAAALFVWDRQAAYSKEWRYTASTGEVVIDTGETGQIRRWTSGGKVFVNREDALKGPLLLELADGHSARFKASSSHEEKSENGTGLIIKGALHDGQWTLPAQIRYEVSPDAAQIRVSFSASQPKEAAPLISGWNWSLPFALAPRKQVYFRGENGLDWETRYFYQFTARSGELMPQPDRNEWRWFVLDQLGPKAFRLWKAESETTSAITMQEGRNIPPYAQVRDPDHGVTIEYPSLAAAAPRSLRIDASAGATVQVQMWPSSLAPTAADTPGLFGTEHQIILTAAPNEATLFAKRASLNAQYPLSNRPNPEETLHEPTWITSPAAAQDSPQYVTGGCPFAQGEVRDAGEITVSVAGKGVPHQSKILGFWPDGSAKWVLLTFPIDPAKGVAECPPPYVSLRSGKFLPVAIAVAPIATRTTPVAETMPTLSASVTPEGAVEIQNKPFSVTFAKGTQWLSAQLDGRPVLTPTAKSRLAYADYLLDPKSVSPLRHQTDGGNRDRGTLTITKVELEQSGPLRAVVRLEGMTDNKEPTRVILRAVMEAGRPEIHLTHTAEFLFKDPRRTFLTGLGIELPLAGFNLSEATFGNFASPSAKKANENNGASELFQESQFSRLLMVEKDGRRKREAVEGNGGWISASNQDTRFLGLIRNFTESAPKAISVSPERDAVRFEIWPQSAGVMDVRRYSNYPHLIQGETSTGKEDWVQTDYYPNDPFVGESRSHEMLLGFWPAQAAPETQAAAADFQSPPLLYAGWDRYASCGVVLPHSSREEWPKAWETWTDFSTFWLYHRALHNWYGFWDFGDFRHHFQDGYGWLFPPDVTVEALRDPKSPALKSKQFIDYRPENDWAIDNGRWGWSNSEGLPNLFLQQEYLRHGNRVVYFAAEAMARFSRDVVIRHDGKWFGKGTRHGVQHWSDGNHEERQTTSTEFRLHYFLSGDDRTRDVVNKLYDRYYSQSIVTNEAGHSGRWGGLLFHWEMSGDAAEAAQMQSYANAFIGEEGLYLTPSLKFPGPTETAAPSHLNGGSMFFYNYGAMHNLVEYQQMTGNPYLAEAIIKMADKHIQTPILQQVYSADNFSGDQMIFPSVAFAALHAPNPAPYRAFLTQWMQGGGWRRLYQTVSKNPAHWSGDDAFLHGNMPGCLFWNNWAPYVTSALGKDAIWNDKIEAIVEKTEKEGKPTKRAPLSWQTEFDGVEGLSKYLDSQKPWIQQKAKDLNPQ